MNFFYCKMKSASRIFLSESLNFLPPKSQVVCPLKQSNTDKTRTDHGKVNGEDTQES